MKNILPILAVAATLMASCQSKSAKKTSGTDSTAVLNTDSTKSSTACFRYAKNKDTAMLTLNTKGTAISGDLTYALFEKDRNKGSISGIVKGDTLIADYTFQSEGQTSIRQVAFLKKGDTLIEGFGDTEEKQGKTIFKNLNTLTFVDAMVFSKTDPK